MRAYRIHAVDRKDDAPVGTAIVIARAFDGAVKTAREFFAEQWKGVDISEAREP